MQDNNHKLQFFHKWSPLLIYANSTSQPLHLFHIYVWHTIVSRGYLCALLYVYAERVNYYFLLLLIWQTLFDVARLARLIRCLLLVSAGMQLHHRRCRWNVCIQFCIRWLRSNCEFCNNVTGDVRVWQWTAEECERKETIGWKLDICFWVLIHNEGMKNRPIDNERWCHITRTSISLVLLDGASANAHQLEIQIQRIQRIRFVLFKNVNLNIEFFTGTVWTVYFDKCMESISCVGQSVLASIVE